jgi:hypothetical protein
VVATYAAFLYAVWVHPPRTYQVVWVLFYAGLTSSFWPALEEATGKWVRRAIAGLALLFAAWVIWKPPLHRHINPVGMDGAVFAFAVLALMSALGVGRLVGSGYAGWMVNAMRKGAKLNWRGQQRLAREGFLFGLEGFAWNEYGMRFKNLTEEQRLAVEQMQRAYPQGRWMAGTERKLVDDERMRQEDNRVRAVVQRTMSFVLGCSAVVWSWAAVSGWKVGGKVIAEWAWTVFALAITLRQAIVLWSEDDPSGVGAEMELVEREA